MQTAMHRWWRSKWWAPLYSLGLGAIVFAAFAIGGNPADGARAFALFVIVALVFWFGSSRSETLGGLGGTGRDGNPYGQLLAVGGLAYIAAILYACARS